MGLNFYKIYIDKNYYIYLRVVIFFCFQFLLEEELRELDLLYIVDFNKFLFFDDIKNGKIFKLGIYLYFVFYDLKKIVKYLSQVFNVLIIYLIVCLLF